eukprot:1392102-Amorphochlora_amoeboformis.AAC.1
MALDRCARAPTHLSRPPMHSSEGPVRAFGPRQATAIPALIVGSGAAGSLRNLGGCPDAVPTTTRLTFPKSWALPLKAEFMR